MTEIGLVFCIKLSSGEELFCHDVTPDNGLVKCRDLLVMETGYLEDGTRTLALRRYIPYESDRLHALNGTHVISVCAVNDPIRDYYLQSLAWVEKIGDARFIDGVKLATEQVESMVRPRIGPDHTDDEPEELVVSSSISRTDPKEFQQKVLLSAISRRSNAKH